MVETALSKISQFVQESEGNMVDQTDLNLNTIFKALSNISDFILKEQEPITETVSNKEITYELAIEIL